MASSKPRLCLCTFCQHEIHEDEARYTLGDDNVVWCGCDEPTYPQQEEEPYGQAIH